MRRQAACAKRPVFCHSERSRGISNRFRNIKRCLDSARHDSRHTPLTSSLRPRRFDLDVNSNGLADPRHAFRSLGEH